MDPKTLLRSFWKLINVFRIVVLQGLSIFFIAYAAGLLAMAEGVRGCPPRPEYLNWFFGVIAALAGVFFLISVYYILKPSVWTQKIDGNLVMSPLDTNIRFFSTHPIFVFLDVLFFIPAIALFQAGRAETMCQFNNEWASGWAALLLALFYPSFRLFSWFVLNRRIEAMTLRQARLTIAWFYLFAFPVFTFFTYTYLDRQVWPRLRVPVVNELTFKGGLDKNPEFEGRIVRVQGKLVRAIAKCGLFGRDETKFPYPYGTVLLDMGKRNGQIMVQVKKPSEVEDLETEAENRMGRIFEAFGYLSKLPNPEKKLICGIGKADSEQKGGLALLEVEIP